jgi:hypothetical protein
MRNSASPRSWKCSDKTVGRAKGRRQPAKQTPKAARRLLYLDRQGRSAWAGCRAGTTFGFGLIGPEVDVPNGAPLLDTPPVPTSPTGIAGEATRVVLRFCGSHEPGTALCCRLDSAGRQRERRTRIATINRRPPKSDFIHGLVAYTLDLDLNDPHHWRT